MTIFVNRTLNLKKIKAIGFDMDYTLIRYHTNIYENETFKSVRDLLISQRQYPEQIKSLTFNPKIAIRGLVLDSQKGNLLKLSCFGKVKTAYHGSKSLNFKSQQNLYKGYVVDISLPQYICIDTAFSMAHAASVSYTHLTLPTTPYV